jgi:hypothetical protein
MAGAGLSWGEHLAAADLQASRDFDRTITTLASGALAISLVFIHDVAPKPEYVPLVVVAWACFAVSLLATLASFLISQIALRADMHRIDHDLPEPERRWAAGFTTFLNWAAMLILVGGVAFLVTFASENLG